MFIRRKNKHIILCNIVSLEKQNIVNNKPQVNLDSNLVKGKVLSH